MAATAVFFVKSARSLSTSTTFTPLSAAASSAGITSMPIGVMTIASKPFATASSIWAIWQSVSDGDLHEKY